jgi:hypothetical protein
MKKLCLLFFLVSNFSIAGGLDEYMSAISNQCTDINQLIVKKSLIELTQEQSCNSPFTTLLLKQCPQLKCASLINSLVTLNGVKSGSVIGN